MKHLIVTSSDSKYGDFLVNHWLVSLKENVNLTNIDVMVLDYGLEEKHIRALTNSNVIVIKCKKDGHVTSLRYRDLLTILSENKYDQVLMVDGGDIIFQRDISDLFSENKSKWRGVVEDTSLKFDQIYQFQIKNKNIRKQIIKGIEGKKFINGGFVIAPADEFVAFCSYYIKEVKDLSSYGVDQAMVTYYIYTHDFCLLDKSYNFMIISNYNTEGYQIKDTRFFKPTGELIHVVHNPGKTKLIRGMSKFGYKIKPKHNIVIYISKLSSQTINLIVSVISKVIRQFQR